MSNRFSVSGFLTNGLLLVLCIMTAVELTHPVEGRPAPGAPAAVTAADLRRLELVADRLEVALARGRSEALPAAPMPLERSSPVPTRPAVVPEPPSTCEEESFRKLIGTEPKREAVREQLAEGISRKDRMRRFGFRTYRSIIEELGFPDNIETSSNGVSFHYAYEADGTGGSLVLGFQDGLVLEVE